MVGAAANNLTSVFTSQLQGRQSLLVRRFNPLAFPLSPKLLTSSAVMASRRLAFQLNQALRSRAALKSIQPVKRGFASPVTLPSRTQSTTLSNGLTVRSLDLLNGLDID